MMGERGRVVFAVAMLAIALPARAELPDARYLEGLRERRQFELAESYCIDRLSRIPPGDAAEAELTVELIRTFALHAVHAPPDKRDPLWTKARAAAASFLRQSPPPPRSLLVRLQDALTLLAQGELGRQEFEAGGLPAEQVEPARQALRQATTLLETLDKDLRAEIPLRRRAAPRAGELTANELTGLADQVQQQLARAQRNRALLFSVGSDDRLSLLIAAVDTLKRALPQASGNEPLKSAMQLDLAECQRLLGRYPEAAELAAALDRDGSAATTRLRARAERIRVAASQGDLEAAQRLIEQPRIIDGQMSAELDFARFEALLALAQAAREGRRLSASGRGSGEALAKKYEEQAANAAELLDQMHGAYWGRRASAAFGGLIAALPRGSLVSAELLSRAADSFYLKGDFEQALVAYDAAAAQARSKGDTQAAFELAYKAALVEQQRGGHIAAASRLQILAKSMVAHSQAPQAHLLAAWNAAEAARGDTAAAGMYEELLAEHLAMWPAAESADQARLWLGKICETKSDWAGAIHAYASVSRASPHYGAAIAASARSWRAELATLAPASKVTVDRALEAIAFFKRAIAGPENRWPERWTEADRAAALAAAELIVRYVPGPPLADSDAEDLLRRALANSSDAPPPWQTAAQAQLVVALAAQGGRQNEALAELKAIGAGSPDSAKGGLAVLDGLALVARRTSERGRPSIARLQLAAAEMLSSSREQLSRDQQLTLDRVRVEALASVGSREEALAAYEQLAGSNPESGAVQEGYARLLLSSAEPAQLKRALDQWRLVASRTKERTPRWYESKYSVALAQFKLGDRAGAATLLRYLLETPPGLKGSEWEAVYSDLLRQCRQ